MDSTTDVFIYCYFCPNRNTFHTYPRNLTLTEVLRAYTLLNGQGYGLHVRGEYPFGLAGLPVTGFGDFIACEKILTGRNEGLNNFNKALDDCLVSEIVIISLGQDIFNIYFALNSAHVPSSEWDIANWFTHVVIFENIFGEMPLETVDIRSSLFWTEFDLLWKAIAGVKVEAVSNFDFSILTAMTPMVWVGLIIVVVLYSLMCQHLIKAMDIIWPLF